jgi:phosphonate transport system substrate-binding protein
MFIFCSRFQFLHFLLVASLFFSSAGFATIVCASDALLWSPTLLEHSSEREKEFQAFNDWLAKNSGQSLSVALEPDYAQMIARFERDELAMLWVGPHVLKEVLAHRPEAQILAMTQDATGRTDYHCVLFARKEYTHSASLSLRQSVALTQPLSTCGSVGVTGIASLFGVDAHEINGRFTGSHQNVIISVMLGEMTAGIIARQVYERFSWLPLKVLSISPQMPAFVWLVNPRLVNAEQQQSLRLAFAQAKSADVRHPWYVAFRYGFETDAKVIEPLITQFIQESP